MKNDSLNRILIIDDIEAHCNTLTRIFSEKGYSCTSEKDMKKAIEIIKKDKEIALVILDMLLPGDNKWTDNIRSILTLNNKLIIIAISGNPAIIEKKHEVTISGAVDFWEKPSGHDDPSQWYSLVDIADQYLSQPIEVNTSFLLDYWNNNNVSGKSYTCIIDSIKDKKFFTDIFKTFFNNKNKYDLKVKDFLENSEYIDWLLTINDKRYRNHSEHQINVALLGWFLSNVEVERNCPLRNKCCELIGKKPDGYNKAWWIASLLHDHGYPIAHLLKSIYARKFIPPPSTKARKKVKAINRNIETLYQDIISKSILDLLKDFKENRLFYIINRTISGLFKGWEFSKEDIYDHGVISAANLLLEMSDEQSTCADTWLYKEAITAICWHNKVDKLSNISLLENPIAFLLVLCDSIQEWGRRIIINNKSYIESNNIVLWLNKRVDDGEIIYSFPRKLRIGFPFINNEVLKATKWDYDLFIKSLKNNLDKLIIFNKSENKLCEIEIEVITRL